MNKSELIEAVAKTAGISKATAGDALDATLSAIKVALKKEQSVTLVGFGTFKVGKNFKINNTVYSNPIGRNHKCIFVVRKNIL